MNSRFFSRLLKGGETVVAYVNGQAVVAETLKQNILHVVSFLQNSECQRWLLWADSPYHFLVQFGALCLSGKTIVLPGNNQPGNLDRISGVFDAVLSDVKLEWQGDVLQCVLPLVIESNSLAQVSAYSGVDPDIILYTSGSTGEPKAIKKTLSLLVTEVAAQDQVWRHKVGVGPVVSTVGHQHIYGMLHSVLWPMYRGAAFVEPLPHLAEEILQIAQKYQPCVLVSSPTHLKRLPSQVSLDNESSLFKVVFSSAGKLDERDSKAMTVATGHSPVEIFGSTETGGVAWRQYGAEPYPAWKCLPDISVSKHQESGCLMIQSPYMIEPVYEMSDCIDVLESEKQEQVFLLKGRSDRVVKVEGKRLSITEVEAVLTSHDWVADARVTVVKGKREEVCAVVILNTSGIKALSKVGKLALNKVLKHKLSVHFEMPLLPRRWRYVDAFPMDSQGKITFDCLISLF